MPKNIKEGYTFTYGAGSYAEVYSLNQALLANPQASTSNFITHVVRSGKKLKPAGMMMPTCPHCNFITEGFEFSSEVKRLENKVDVLSKEYILEHGIDFDEELWFSSYSDEVLDKPEEENGNPFTGLAYELYDNGNLAYYCYYKNGFKEGNYVKFHHNGKVKSTDYMIKGQTRGIRKIWYESEELKYEGEFKFGVCLKYTEWDKQGNIIRQKVAPTKEELELITRLSDCDDNE